jgi:glycosyltransferase involved in cell wall biosynthesis
MAKAGMVGRVAAWLAGVPVIIHTYHGHVFSGYFSPAKTSLYIMIERMLALFSTGIIAISDRIKQDICSVYKIASERKVRIIPLGFELQKMEPLKKYQGILRNQFSIPDRVPIIGIVGRMTAIKNHLLFVEIACLLLKKNKNIHFMIIGDGELRGEIEKKVQDIGISDHVHFCGWVTDAGKIYADLDIMLLTSLNEGTPVTVIEAMYYQIPVVSSNVGGLPDMIESGKTGFLIDSFNAKDYIPVILRLLESNDERNAMGETASHYVNERYNIDRLIIDIKNLYQEFLKKKGIA